MPLLGLPVLLCVLKYRESTCACHKGIWVGGGIKPLIHNLSSSWRWVVPATAALRNGERAADNDWRLGWPQRWTGCLGDEKNLLPIMGIEPHFLGCPVTDCTIPFSVLFCTLFNILQYSHCFYKCVIYLTFMEPCIARCVFDITNEMQLI